MRRSFGPGMGSGGGGMIKNVQRVMRAGINNNHHQSTTRTTATNNHQSTAPSLSSNNHHHPLSAVSPPNSDDSSDWEYIHNDGETNEYVFGSVPSKHEVHHALSSLQQVVDVVSFSHDEYGINNKQKILLSRNSDQLDWTEPSLEVCNYSISSSELQVPSCSSRVYDAFHLMQTDPSVQRMVISLSSDKAVWDAVMNNEVVRELGESIGEDKLSIWEDDVGCNPVKQVLGWMLMNTKDKVVEIVERITKIVNELLQPNKEEERPKKEGSDSFQEKLRSSFLLSIMVLLIVVVTRGNRNA